jgi:hypothetical protein
MNTRLTIHRSLSTNGDFQRSYTGYENEWRRNVNLKVVLRTYGLLRQLTDDETALLETLRGLTDSDREQLVESLTPAKAAVRKRVRKTQVKSPRAESLASAIAGTAKSAVPVADGPLCTVCAHPEDYEDHAQPSPHYHAFEAAGAKASVAAGD